MLTKRSVRARERKAGIGCKFGVFRIHWSREKKAQHSLKVGALVRK
jgi:hypothetical protein